MVNSLYEIYKIDSDDSLYRLDPHDASLTRSRQVDRLDPRELTMTFDRGVPIKELDRVLVKKMGKIIFRGYVKFYEISNKREKKVRCFGMEDLLLYRSSHTFFYDKFTDATIGDLVSDTLESGKLPGLLACANSYVLPGQTYEKYDSGATNIAYMPACGTSSNFGEHKIYVAGNDGLEGLEEVEDLATLVANASDTTASFYRDAYTLWIEIGEDLGNAYWYEIGGLFVENSKDTFVRLGNVDAEILERDMVGTLMVSWNKIGDLIINLCAAHGYYVTFTDDDDHTLLNIYASEGRQPQRGVYTFYEEDLVEILKNEKDDPLPTAICGRGEGLQYYTRDDNSSASLVRIEEVVDYDLSWKDDDGDLQALVDEEYKNRNNRDNWTIEPYADDLLIDPADWLKIKLDYEPEVLAKVEKIEEDCLTGHMTIDLSEHRTNASDVWEFLQDIDSGYTVQYPCTCAPSVSSVLYEEDNDEGVYIEENGYFKFDLPEGAIDAELKPRAMMSISFTQGDTDDSPTEADVMGRCNIWIGTWTSSITWWLVISNITIGENANYTIPDIDVTDFLEKDDDDYYYIAAYIDAVESTVPSTTWFRGNASLTFYKRAE